MRYVDGRPMLLGVVDALLGGGSASVTVVTSGQIRAELPPLPERVRVVINEDPAPEMIDSIRIGLNGTGSDIGAATPSRDATASQPGSGSEPAGFLVCSVRRGAHHRR